MSFIKNNNLFIFTFFLVMSCASDTNFSENDLLGTWQGDYNGRDLIITFNENDFVMKIENKSKNSYDLLDGTYITNFQKSPIPLSMIDISNLSHPLHTIIFFEDPETVIIKNFSPSWKLRSISFDDSGNHFILKRLIKER